MTIDLARGRELLEAYVAAQAVFNRKPTTHERDAAIQSINDWDRWCDDNAFALLAAAEREARHYHAQALMAQTVDAANARADAIPREPTEAMQKAGLAAMFDVEHSDLKRRELYLLIRKCWRAMFDAARSKP